MNDRELLEGRIRELSKLSYERDILKRTDFLSLSEQAVFHEMKKEDIYSECAAFGGYGEAERKVLFFLPSYISREDMLPLSLGGKDKETSYEGGSYEGESYSAYAEENIALIKARPLNEKFSESLTHRDYLGALMNLGIERAKLGDIVTDGAFAYIFCLPEVRDIICGELKRVRHTSVYAEAVSLSECAIRPKLKELSVNVASERADAVISAVFNLSRNISAELIEGESVFADGKLIRQASCTLKEGSRVSVRGYGKFIFCGVSGSTRKGRLYVNVKRFA